MQLSTLHLDEALGQTDSAFLEGRIRPPACACRARATRRAYTHPTVRAHLVQQISSVGIEQTLGEVVQNPAQQMNAGAV